MFPWVLLHRKFNTSSACHGNHSYFPFEMSRKEEKAVDQTRLVKLCYVTSFTLLKPGWNWFFPYPNPSLYMKLWCWPYNHVTQTRSTYFQESSTGGPCRAGSYCPEGSSRALPCVGGSYAPNDTMSECIVCPNGTYCSPAASQTVECQPGYYCPENSTFEIPCEKGTYNKQSGWLLFNFNSVYWIKLLLFWLTLHGLHFGTHRGLMECVLPICCSDIYLVS